MEELEKPKECRGKTIVFLSDRIGNLNRKTKLSYAILSPYRLSGSSRKPPNSLQFDRIRLDPIIVL